MIENRIARAAAAAMASAALLAACSGATQPTSTAGRSIATLEAARSPAAVATRVGSPSPTATQAPAAVDPRDDGITVGFGEWAVTAEADTIRPGTVTFVVENRGQLEHGFEIESESDDGPEYEVEGPLFAGGDTVTISADLAPGTYEIYCWVADHEDRGMQMQLVVREDAPLIEPTPAPQDTVSISGFAFAPTTIEVAVGTQVVWRNDDPTEHTVTAEDGSFGSEALGEGGTFVQRFDRAGSYAYFCAIHPAMTARIEVP